MALRPRTLSWLLSVAVWAVGCGGSSSETPPPLEPLPVNLHYDRSATALSGEEPAVVDAGVVRRSEEEPQDATEPLAPVRSTWGTERGSAPAPLK